MLRLSQKIRWESKSSPPFFSAISTGPPVFHGCVIESQAASFVSRVFRMELPDEQVAELEGRRWHQPSSVSRVDGQIGEQADLGQRNAKSSNSSRRSASSSVSPGSMPPPGGRWRTSPVTGSVISDTRKLLPRRGCRARFAEFRLSSSCLPE